MPRYNNCLMIATMYIHIIVAQTLSTCVEDGQKATESVDTSKVNFKSLWCNVILSICTHLDNVYDCLSKCAGEL